MSVEQKTLSGILTLVNTFYVSLPVPKYWLKSTGS